MSKRKDENPQSNTEEQALISALLMPEYSALIAVKYVGASSNELESLSSFAIVEEIKKQAEKIQQGDISNIERQLYSQAVALNAIFKKMLMHLSKSQIIDQMQIFGSLALKAQNQSRVTLETLARIKNPNKTTFIKQQNNAVNQQINNQATNENKSENFSKSKTELLSEQKHETLDISRTTEAGKTNLQLETVEKLNGSENKRRKRSE